MLKRAGLSLGLITLVAVGLLSNTQAAHALNGWFRAECVDYNAKQIVNFGMSWTNDTAKDIAYKFDTGIPGEPTTEGVAAANTEDAIDFSRGLDTSKNGLPYTLTLTFDSTIVYQATWVNACPWQGSTVTIDKFTAATDPSPTPTSPIPTSPAPTTPSTPPGSTTQPPPTELANQSLKSPAKKVKRGKTAKLARTTQQGARITWRSASPKTCKVTGYKVRGIKKGECQLTASAPPVAGHSALVGHVKLMIR